MGDELKTLMTLRQRTLDEAESGLAAARRQRERREEEHARARAGLAAAEEAIGARVRLERKQQTRGIRGGQWVDERRYQARLCTQRNQAEAVVRSEATRVAQAEAAEEIARQGVLKARRQVEVLEKHQERQAAQQRRQDLRQSEKEQDDLANARHGR